MAGTINKPKSKSLRASGPKCYCTSPFKSFHATNAGLSLRLPEPKSKRMTTRLRKNIERKSAAKQKKGRKQAKNNPEWRSKLKKDPGIPNLLPYKDKILAEIEERRARKVEEAQRRKELAKAARTGVAEINEVGKAHDHVPDDDGVEDEVDDTMEVDGEENDESNPMAALLASARAAAQDYEKELQDGSDFDDDSSEGGFGGEEMDVSRDSSRKAFDKVYKQVVEQADVILYVLDARDPEGTRSREIERGVMAASASGKRLILILNKIDLVPPHVLKGWLAHLRRFFPTLPLRASNPAPNAHTFNHKDLTIQNTSATLFRALKAFATSRNLKRAISVGVIGYPNVGKSSVINALLSRLGGKAGTASRSCPAGAEAGVTTAIRAVKIDNKLTLVDSPGIIFPSQPTSSSGVNAPKTAQEKHAHLVLLNVVPPKQIDDPVPAVTLLLDRMSSTADLLQKVLDVYDVPPLVLDPDSGGLTMPFLVEVARRRGRLSKGGVPNINAAAMTVVTDWRDGRIQGWTEAPTMPVVVRNGGDKVLSFQHGAAPEDDVAPDEKVLVSEWAEEFKLVDLFAAEEAPGTGDVDMGS
jgi:nuclear GTP-binding protein